MAGEFLTCGCHYTTDDDGIHQCALHATALELLEACQIAIHVMVASGSFAYKSDRDAAIGNAYNSLQSAIAKATS